MSDLEAVSAAMRPNTRLVILESPTNPLIRLADIAAVAEIAHASGAKLLVDNTVATPVAQSPIELGADIVVMALTKYIAGHHDVLGGVIIFAEEDELGASASFGWCASAARSCRRLNSWLALRGLQSMAYRVRAISEHAPRRSPASWRSTLKLRRCSTRITLATRSTTLAKRQMRVGSGLMSILAAGGRQAAIDLVNNLQLFTSATSFGGTHSLIEHRESIEEDSETPGNLLRICDWLGASRRPDCGFAAGAGMIYHM